MQKGTKQRVADQLQQVDEFRQQNPNVTVGSLVRHHTALTRARVTSPGPVTIATDPTTRQMGRLDALADDTPDENEGVVFKRIKCRFNDVEQIIELDTYSLRLALKLPTLIQNIRANSQTDVSAIPNLEDPDHVLTDEEDNA